MKLFTRNIKAHDNTVTRTDKVPDFEKINTSNVLETDFIKSRFIDTIEDNQNNRINLNQPIIVEDQDDNPPMPITPDMLSQAMYDWHNSSTIDVELEKELKELYIHTSTSIQANDYPYIRQMAINYLNKQKSPIPSPTILYSFEEDISDQATNYLSNSNDANYNELLTGLTGVLFDKPTSRLGLVIAVKNHADFEDIVNTAIQLQKNQINTNNKDLTDVQADLASAKLSAMDAYHFDESSSAIPYLMSAINRDNDTLVPPLNIKTFLKSNTLIVLNIEELTYLNSNNEFLDALNKLNKDIKNRINAKRYASIKKISRASKTPRNKSHQRGQTKSSDLSQSNNSYIKKSNTKQKPKEMLKKIAKLISSRVSRLRSENEMTAIKRTFQRGSRRNPDDVNLKGSIKKKIYNPDIHIYLDSSGSISEKMYADAIYSIILITQKLKSDLYFSSFSDAVSQPVKIRVSGKTAKQVYEQILKIPKISGGTRFDQVYYAIDDTAEYNKRSQKAQRLNFMITDFGYSFEDTFQFNSNAASVKNTFYIPMQMDYPQATLDLIMERFQESAIQANNSKIGRHIL